MPQLCPADAAAGLSLRGEPEVRAQTLSDLLPQLTLESAAAAGGSSQAPRHDVTAGFEQSATPFPALHDDALSGLGTLWTIPTFDLTLPLGLATSTLTLYSQSFVPVMSQGHISLSTTPAMQPWQVPETTADKDMILAARDASLQSLHSILEQPGAYVSDMALEAVINIALGDLCYGELQGLRVHLNGARGMVRSRGGLAAMNGDDTLHKMLILADLTTAIAAETPPSYSDEEIANFTSFLAIRSPYSATSATTPTTFTGPPLVDTTTSATLRDVNFLLAKASRLNAPSTTTIATVTITFDIATPTIATAAPTTKPICRGSHPNTDIDHARWNNSSISSDNPSTILPITLAASHANPDAHAHVTDTGSGTTPFSHCHGKQPSC
ncbi:hypothetical protein VTJ49DRAFT_2580 [Mycothermus thermophilus]|uniref:Uncharacterized protein n=1 Tax=Humicola insolens TaxID=85995 RepID=A0ABR3VMX6_HUMIN